MAEHPSKKKRHLSIDDQTTIRIVPAKLAIKSQKKNPQKLSLSCASIIQNKDNRCDLNAGWVPKGVTSCQIQPCRLIVRDIFLQDHDSNMRMAQSVLLVFGCTIYQSYTKMSTIADQDWWGANNTRNTLLRFLTPLHHNNKPEKSNPLRTVLKPSSLWIDLYTRLDGCILLTPGKTALVRNYQFQGELSHVRCFR